MRKLTLSFLFCLFSSTVGAETFQIKKVLICDKAENIFTALAKDWNEIPVWGGKSSAESMSFVLTSNPKTGAWTLIQYTNDIACVLGVGENSNLMPVEKT